MARSRRQARRSDAHTPGWLWFTFGLLAGLGIATLAWLGGYLPRADESPVTRPDGRNEPPIAEAPGDHYEETNSIGESGWPRVKDKLEQLLAWEP